MWCDELHHFFILLYSISDFWLFCLIVYSWIKTTCLIQPAFVAVKNIIRRCLLRPYDCSAWRINMFAKVYIIKYFLRVWLARGRRHSIYIFWLYAESFSEYIGEMRECFEPAFISDLGNANRCVYRRLKPNSNRVLISILVNPCPFSANLRRMVDTLTANLLATSLGVQDWLKSASMILRMLFKVIL